MSITKCTSPTYEKIHIEQTIQTYIRYRFKTGDILYFPFFRKKGNDREVVGRKNRVNKKLTKISFINGKKEYRSYETES